MWWLVFRLDLTVTVDWALNLNNQSSCEKCGMWLDQCLHLENLMWLSNSETSRKCPGHVVCLKNVFAAFFLFFFNSRPVKMQILMGSHCGGQFVSSSSVLTGWPSCSVNVTVYVWHKPAELAHFFFFSSCIYFSLYGPFNCISFHEFFQQLSVFSLCSSGLISALLVLSTVFLFMKVSFSPGIIPSGWLGS